MSFRLEKDRRLTFNEQQELVVLEEIYPMNPETGRSLYKVQNKQDNLVYALKIYDLNLNQSSSIKNEMLSMNKLLQRPELFPRFRSYTEQQGMGLLRMDWMDGQSLERVYRTPPKGKADLELRMKTFTRLCDTLTLVHASRVVHRDLKPANILLRNATDAGNHVILIDFGLAFERRSKRGEGTSGYCAPEQLFMRDFSISPQTDIFSLAQVGIWLLAGSTAPLAPNEDFTGWDNAQPGCLCQLSPFITPAAEALLLKPLAYSPKERPRDCQVLKSFSREVLKSC